MTMSDLDTSTPEAHRARYMELKRNAARRNEPRGKVPSALRALSAAEVLHEETIPGGWYWTTRVARGQRLRIVNPGGRASVSTLIWNADDLSERYNAGDTVKIQWKTVLGKGDVLFSDMGRVLASIVEDSGAGHDALVGGSTRASNEERYGPAPLRNARDNFCLAAAKFGLTRRDIMPCLTFFAPVRTGADGALAWSGAVEPRSFVELRAEMNLLVALSNSPHPYDPHADYAPGPVEATLWRGLAVEPTDLCRTASEEALRGFDNTDALFGA
jgi:urea carboxylase-associated protein 2